jgi:tellurite methyltransferase
MLGTALDCVRCDRMEFPEGLHEYKRTPVFTETALPKGLLRDHSTKAGTWGLIHILEGHLRYTVHYPEERSLELLPGMAGIVVPEMKHRVEPVGAVRFCVAFYSSIET